ncbi:MAG: hypothetical protein R3F18_14960 [Lysobacterales bacterium]|nr:hypothetical protein [Xanthomonadales bacterium]
MRIPGWGFVALLLCISSVHAEEQAPTADPKAAAATPSWAPGPILEESTEPPPGRVASRDVGVALTLPESWRGEDVSWRALDPEETLALSELAQAALVVEFKDKRGAAQPLVTIYRVKLTPWREAAAKGAAGPGRLTLTSPETGYVVVRSDQSKARGRFGELRADLEDAVGTLALYDAHRETRHLIPRVQSDFAGTLEDGSQVSIKLNPNGQMTLTFGKQPRTLEGLWFQRGVQVVARLTIPKVQTSPRFEAEPELLFHYDGKGLIAIKWDQKVLGPLGVRLEQTP